MTKANNHETRRRAKELAQEWWDSKYQPGLRHWIDLEQWDRDDITDTYVGAARCILALQRERDEARRVAVVEWAHWAEPGDLPRRFFYSASDFKHAEKCVREWAK